MEKQSKHNGIKTKRHRSSIDLKRLKEFKQKYAKRYFYMVVNKRKQGERLLGQNSIIFLLLSLQRSKLMFDAFLDCLKSKQPAVAYLVVRAHFEATGLIAYFYKHLRRFYTNKIKYEEMDRILYGLTLGCRTFPEKKARQDENIPASINVLTLIGEADKLFNSMAKEEKNVFLYCYEFLSEFCHPNHLGLTLGSDIVDRGTTVFKKKPKLREGDLRILESYLYISSTFFFVIYDKCFDIVKDREATDMPELLKNFPSAVLTSLKRRSKISFRMSDRSVQ